MKILVTGGAGFIGSHIVDALSLENHEIVVLDNLMTGTKRNLDSHLKSGRIKLIQGDIKDVEHVKNAFNGVDFCFHYAAAVGVDLILKDPIESIRNNIYGTENIMSTASEHGIPMIFASTSEIYGKNPSKVLTEDSDRVVGNPALWRWSYSDAKALDEAFASALASLNGFKVKTIRYFNTVGPRQSEFYGMVIPKFVSAAINNRTIRVYGDGTQKRVFCHIDDAVAGTLSLWRKNSGYGEVFNLGGLEEITILDLAKLVIEKTNSKSEIEFVPYSELKKLGYEDIPRRVPGVEKLTSATNWRPVKGIERILSDYIEFFLSKDL